MNIYIYLYFVKKSLLEKPCQFCYKSEKKLKCYKGQLIIYQYFWFWWTLSHTKTCSGFKNMQIVQIMMTMVKVLGIISMKFVSAILFGYYRWLCSNNFMNIQCFFLQGRMGCVAHSWKVRRICKEERVDPLGHYACRYNH